MTRLIAVNKNTNTAVVSHGGVFVFIDTESKDVIRTDDNCDLNAADGWEASNEEPSQVWKELAEAATTSLSIESTEHAEADRVFRVPRNVQTQSATFSADTTTLQKIHEFASGRYREPKIVHEWVSKITTQFPAPNTIVAAGFAPEDTSVYFGRAVGPDTTECDAMYALNAAGEWAERKNGQWVPLDAEYSPEDAYSLIMLDPESAIELANWADNPAGLDGASLELAALSPVESGLFYAAEAELDMEFLDRVFDVYDSMERSVNAKKQVRAQGGRFGPSPGGAKATAEAPKARLSTSLPLIPNIASRIDQYLAEVEKARGGADPAEPADPQPGDDEKKFSTADFNWVEDVGGLPPYIKRIAKHLKQKGMAEGRAIATAVNVVKKMCATGDLNWPGKQDANPGSQAEACAAVAEWEAKKAEAKATSIAKAQEFAVTAEQSGVPTTDVKPLYIAIVDDIDTDAVLDLVSLVPPAKGVQGDVTAWKRAAGQWVAANDILSQLRGSTPPSCVEVSDPAVLKEVIAQVDKSTAEEGVEQPVPGETEVAPDGTAPANQPAQPKMAPVEMKKSNFEVSGTDLIARGYAFSDGSLLIRNATELREAVKEAQGFEQQLHVIRRARALNRTDIIPRHWNVTEASVKQSLWGPYGELLPVVAAGGLDQNRGGAERLRHYWTRGLGGAKIGWGSPRDWTRCVAYLSKYLGARAKGYCALRHKEMNGYYPGDRRNV